MNNTELNKILDMTYELEGLLHLTLSKECSEASRGHIENLIRQKISNISAALTPEESRPETPQPAEPEPDDTPLLEEEEMTKEAILEDDEPETPEPTQHQYVGDVNALLKRFSLNDTFRFRRELFGGSDAEFKEALGIIAGFDSIEEAEDYVYNELRLDPDSPETIAFMDVIENHFSR